MNLYHVTYYYLATGMDGRADDRDHGYVTASSAADACRIVGDRTYPEAPPKDRTWGLSATLVGGLEPPRPRHEFLRRTERTTHPCAPIKSTWDDEDWTF